MPMFKKRSTKPKRRAAPKRNYKRGKAYAYNKAYKYKRLGKTATLYNSTVLGQILSNDNTMISPGSTATETGNLGYMFGAGMNFRLANVSGSADFTALYDQYRIAGVKVNIIPLSSEATAQSSGFVPTLYWARDSDDSLPPATEPDLRERQDCKMARLTRPVSIYVKSPKASIDVVDTLGTSSPSMIRNGWINCSNTLVQHNGLKLWFKNVDLRVQPTTVTGFRVETTYYLQFRNPQ